MKALLAAILGLALAACAQPPASELQGRWQVQQIAGAPLGQGVEIWMEFDASGERVSGFTGCNAFNTSAMVFGTQVSLAPPTEAPGECPNQFAATDEARFLGVIPGIGRFIRNGRSLELLPAASGSETLIRLRLMDEAE